MSYESRVPAFVTAAEISRNFGRWQDRALESPVIVTHHGRPRVILIASDQYRPGPDVADAPDTCNARLGALINTVSEAFMAMDSDLRFTAVNPVFEAYVGRAAVQVIGRLWTEVFPELENSVLHEHYRRVLRTGEIAEFEVASVLFPGRIVTQRVFPYGGGVAALFHNRTLERERELAVEEAAAIERLARATPGLSLIELNLRGGLSRVDDRFAALSGFGREALLSFRLADIVRPKDRSRLLASIDMAIEGEGAPSLRTWLLSRDGHEEPVTLTFASILRHGRSAGLKVAVLQREPTTPAA
ncbi:MAG: PAS domain-containing protein [Caulobacter sp.]|nr:PAS domain-containing protein [Caulobacter sp.]